jgi:hypothetical protein
MGVPLYIALNWAKVIVGSITGGLYGSGSVNFLHPETTPKAIDIATKTIDIFIFLSITLESEININHIVDSVQIEIFGIKWSIAHNIARSILICRKTHLFITTRFDISIVEDIIDIQIDSEIVFTLD